MRLEVAYGGAEARNLTQDGKGDSNEQRNREATFDVHGVAFV